MAPHNADEGARLYDSERHASYTLAYGIDVGVGCLAWSAWATWYLGYPDEALDKARAALDLAQSLSDPFGVGLAHCSLASLHLCRKETDEGREHAQGALRIAEEHGIAQWLWYGSVLLGYALSRGGHPDEGIATMKSGIQGWLDVGAHTEMPRFSALLAEATLENRDGYKAQASLSLLAEGLRYVAETGEKYYESELYRLRGEAALPDDPAAAERDFLRAIESSRELSSKSLEAARGDEPRVLLARSRQAGQGAQTLGRRLRLVQRGLRDRRSPGRQGPHGRARSISGAR